MCILDVADNSESAIDRLENTSECKVLLKQDNLTKNAVRADLGFAKSS